jgi:hypothetical protein
MNTNGPLPASEAFSFVCRHKDFLVSLDEAKMARLWK